MTPSSPRVCAPTRNGTSLGAFWRAALLAAPAVAAALLGPSCGTEVNGSPDPFALLRADRRLKPLLQPCSSENSRVYDRDTSDILPILIGKLTFAQRDALQHAKEELGSLGERALGPLRRLFEEHATDPFGSPYVENALDAAGLSQAPGARAILLAGLAQAQSTVRRRALGALLAGPVNSEDFEILAQHVEYEPPDLKISFAQGLHDANPQLAEETYVGWLQRGEHHGTWRHVVPFLAGSREEATWRDCAELFDRAPESLRPWLAAAAARTGDPRFLTYLEAELEQGDGNHRSAAVQALTAAGWIDALLPAFEDDLDDNIRLLALDGIAKAEPFEERYASWVSQAMDDSSPQVRGQAILYMVTRGDPAAIDRALNQLGERTNLLQQGLNALRNALASDEGLARRALEQLATRLALEKHLPPSERLATYKALGLVPLVEATELLYAEALALFGVELEGQRAHRWLTFHAINTGSAGREFLFQALAEETDPRRRLDLIAAASGERGGPERERLMQLLSAGTQNSYEALFAASQLCKIGPGSIVAPFLKRISYDIEDLEVRRALQCLLWTWY